MRRVYALQETDYVNEWFGNLNCRVTIPLFKPNNKIPTIKSYVVQPKKTIKTIRIPISLRGRKVTAVGLLDHFIYLMVNFFLLPVSLLHDTVIFFTPTFFTTIILPVFKLLRKNVYIICVDPQLALYYTYKSKGGVLLRFYWKLSNKLEINSVRMADKVFVVSSYLRKKYLKYNKNVVLTPNGADYFSIKKIRARKHDKNFTIAYFGSIDKWRGVDLLVKAFKIVKTKNKNVKLLILGGGVEEENIRKMCSDDKNIFISGYIQHKKAISYCKDSDILVAPFRRDPILSRTSSIKVFEYIACGVPIIITKTGEHAKIVGDLGVGLLSKATPQDLAKKISVMINNKKLYMSIKSNLKLKSDIVDFKNTRKPFFEEFENCR